MLVYHLDLIRSFHGVPKHLQNLVLHRMGYHLPSESLNYLHTFSVHATVGTIQTARTSGMQFHRHTLINLISD